MHEQYEAAAANSAMDTLFRTSDAMRYCSDGGEDQVWDKFVNREP